MALTARHWDVYWAGGRLTSLPQEFRANYTGPVAEFWTRQFAGLAEGARVLDLCAGNGAVALLVETWAQQQGKTIEVHAVDAARIDPESVARAFPDQKELLARIRFHGGRPVEDLGFESASCDLLCSQYGIEYSDWPRAAAEVTRVLRPGGRFVMLCHAISSDIYPFMHLVEQEYLALDELQFFPSIRAFLQREMSFPAFHKMLRQTQQRVSRLQALHRSPFLASVLGMLEQVLPMNRAQLRREQHRLKQFYLESTLARARQSDMLSVHQRLTAQTDWHRVFTAAGLELEEAGGIAYPAKSGRRTIQAGDFYLFRKPLGSNHA